MNSNRQLRTAPSSQRLAILAHLERHPESSPVAIATAWGKNRVTVRRLLGKLHAAGKVVRRRGGYAIASAADLAPPTTPDALTTPAVAPRDAPSIGGLRYQIIESREVFIERAESLAPAAVALNRRLGVGAWRLLQWESAA